ncbi:uncharacterized protein LOC119830480 isoform X2 [Zerene cesonia]|uniref:uncharacterized protein LOC119830480 isoform X2 n=1 Tax=Zerene cesonia TaxID=33412 RepID=UPI0018E57849|nr:uncharacterized protein LOC119830480 isoform X2 [Zerene cesonia]
MIHQTKKSNKWECKMCGEKQSIKRHYGIGTGKECRLHVQKLNKLQAEKINMPKIEVEEEEEEEEEMENKLKITTTLNYNNKSKWSNYITEHKEIQDMNELMFLDDKEVVLEKPKNVIKSKHKITSHKYSDKDYRDSVTLDDVRSEEKFKSHEQSCNGTPEKNRKIPICNMNLSFTKTKSVTSLVAIEKNTCSNILNNVCISNSQAITNDKQNSLKKNSKWAQFIEVEDSVDENMTSNIEYSEGNKSQMSVAAENNFSHSLPSQECCKSQDLNTSFDSKIPIKENKMMKRAQRNESIFSMVNEHDLDSILNI